MRFRSVCMAATTALAMATLGSTAASAAVSLPTAHCGTTAGTNCLQFDDFTVYDLPLLNLQSNSNNFDVSTNGTFLDNSLVIGTGVSGNGNRNDDQIARTLVDDAYETPSGNLVNFQMDATNQNTQGTGILGGNATTTWDVDVDALVGYLAGGKLAFFFNLNQTNTTTYLANNEDSLGWLAVTLSDSTGAHTSKTFYLDGDACNGQIGVPNSPNCDPSQSFTGDMSAAHPPNQPNPLTQAQFDNQNLLTDQAATHNEWAYIHGQICADKTTGAVLRFGACTGADVNGKTIDQNLGANTAAFALYSDGLQQWLLSGDYDKMSVDLRMAAENNGYEQLLIQAVHIPEPITVTLFGGGLFLVTALRRRKFKTA